jgi:hypothetical protein
VYKVFKEISSENSSFSEVSDVILARSSTRLLTVDNVVADIVAQHDSENEFMEDILDVQDSENDHAGPVHDGQEPATDIEFMITC